MDTAMPPSTDTTQGIGKLVFTEPTKRTFSVVMGRGEKMIQIDMEMPENCIDCPLIAEEYTGAGVYECVWLQKRCLRNQRQKDCPLRETIRCNQCRFYEGVHNVQGCAPCALRGIGAVMWDDYCKRGERND